MVKQKISKIVSTILWDVQAVKISTEEPFKLTSGNMSPIYIDCRIPISYPAVRNIITSCAQWLYEQNLSADYIAGGETAGIPYAAWLADRVGKPFIYVRKEPKGYGTHAQIEGKVKPGSLVLLYEDLITDGKSKLNFVKGIKRAEANVKDCLVIFDRQQGGKEALREISVTLHSMVDMETALNIGLDGEYITKDDFHSVQEYLNNPKQWHMERGYDFFD